MFEYYFVLIAKLSFSTSFLLLTIAVISYRVELFLRDRNTPKIDTDTKITANANCNHEIEYFRQALIEQYNKQLDRE